MEVNLDKLNKRWRGRIALTMVCGVEHAHVRVLRLYAAPGGAHSTVKVKLVQQIEPRRKTLGFFGVQRKINGSHSRDGVALAVGVPVA